MKEIIDYIEILLRDPSDFELHRQVHEDKIYCLVNNYADSRPPTIQQLIEGLEEEYPGVKTSTELIEKGDLLRNEMLLSVFDKDFSTDEVKRYEARISLFDKLIVFDKTISGLIQNIGGIKHRTSENSKKKLRLMIHRDQHKDYYLKMGRRSKYFNTADQRYIQENHITLTVSEMSRNRRIPYSNVYNYMVRRHLTMLSERMIIQKRKQKQRELNKYFDPGQFKNWIV